MDDFNEQTGHQPRILGQQVLSSDLAIPDPGAFPGIVIHTNARTMLFPEESALILCMFDMSEMNMRFVVMELWGGIVCEVCQDQFTKHSDLSPRTRQQLTDLTRANVHPSCF